MGGGSYQASLCPGRGGPCSSIDPSPSHAQGHPLPILHPPPGPSWELPYKAVIAYHPSKSRPPNQAAVSDSHLLCRAIEIDGRSLPPLNPVFRRRTPSLASGASANFQDAATSFHGMDQLRDYCYWQRGAILRMGGTATTPILGPGMPQRPGAQFSCCRTPDFPGRWSSRPLHRPGSGLPPILTLYLI